jgi:hypothetical protein
MVQTGIQKGFAPFKRHLPGFVWKPIRSLATAFLAPAWFSFKTGHFKSSFKMAAVSRKGEPLPWYTYPCIDFLRFRDYQGKSVLEFGGGQSTLWWAQRAARVVAFEGDASWYENLKTLLPGNVNLFLVSMDTRPGCVEEVNKRLDGDAVPGKFDVIIIDGLYRSEMIEIALRVRSEGGVIITDNAEGYGFYEGFRKSGLQRVDFFGHAPGVVLPHCTSVFFGEKSFLFSPDIPIPVVSHQY